MGKLFINRFGVVIAAAIACSTLHSIRDALGKKENDHDPEHHDR